MCIAWTGKRSSIHATEHFPATQHVVWHWQIRPNCQRQHAELMVESRRKRQDANVHGCNWNNISCTNIVQQQQQQQQHQQTTMMTMTTMTRRQKQSNRIRRQHRQQQHHYQSCIRSCHIILVDRITKHFVMVLIATTVAHCNASVLFITLLSAKDHIVWKIAILLSLNTIISPPSCLLQ